MNDFPRPVDHEKEREDGTEEDVVELKKIARPDVSTVVSHESAPALVANAWWPYAPHVLLDRAFADANAQH